MPVGNVLCRPALFCADGIVFVPMASRWPPLTAGGVPTALFRPFEKFVVFIAQESARKCISDAQPTSVLTAGRVSSAWHSNSYKVYPFCILFEFKSCPMCVARTHHTTSVHYIALSCATHLHCYARVTCVATRTPFALSCTFLMHHCISIPCAAMHSGIHALLRI